MPKRAYKKYGEVYFDLEKFCRKHRQNDSPCLPPERELAQILKTSVMTLRKALERGQMDGLLIREGRRLVISRQDRNLYGFGKILFIEQGFYGKPVLGAINRLYQELALRMLALKADFGFYQLNGGTDLKDLERACSRAAVLIAGLFTSDPALNLKVIEILKRQQGRKLVIAVSDPNLGFFNNFCALDNVAVGRKAVETLLAAGCTKLGVVSCNNSSITCKRLVGMEKGCIAAGVPLYYFNGRTKPELLKMVTGSGCDGIFFTTDEEISTKLKDFFAVPGLIPDRLKVLTLHGSGESLLCQPPIACINHATDQVADGIISYLLAKVGNSEQPPLRKLVTPILYPSITLGRNFKIKTERTGGRK